jgi:hypothetical protein
LLQQPHIQAKVSEFKSRASILYHDLSRDSKLEQSFRGLRLERLLNFLHTLVFPRTASFPTLQPLRAKSTAKDRLSPSLIYQALVFYSSVVIFVALRCFQGIGQTSYRFPLQEPSLRLSNRCFLKREIHVGLLRQSCF